MFYQTDTGLFWLHEQTFRQIFIIYMQLSCMLQGGFHQVKSASSMKSGKK